MPIRIPLIAVLVVLSVHFAQAQELPRSPANLPPPPTQEEESATALLKLAVQHIGSGRFERAEPLLRESVFYSDEKLLSHTDVYSTCRMRWVQCLLKTGDPATAEPVLKSILQYFEGWKGGGSPELGRCLIEMGRCQLGLGRGDRSEEYFARGIEALAKYSQRDSAFATGHICLAKIHREKPASGEAAVHLRNASHALPAIVIAMMSNRVATEAAVAAGPAKSESEAFIGTLVRIGFEHSSVQRLKRAEPLFREAVEQMEETKRTDLADYYRAKRTWAKCLYLTGDVLKLDEVLRTLMPLVEEKEGTQSREYSELLGTQVYACVYRADYSERGVTTLEKSLVATERLCGKDGLDHLAVRYNLAYFHITGGRGDLAEKHLDYGLKILEKRTDGDRVKGMYHIGKALLLLESGKAKEADECLDRAEAFMDRDNYADVYKRNSLLARGFIRLRLGDLAAAKTATMASLGSYPHSIKPVEYANQAECLARILKEEKDAAGSRKWIEESLSAREAIQNHESPAYAAALGRGIKLLRELGAADPADRWERKLPGSKPIK